jgi:DNA polymerase elongation subunit (family B)
MSNYLVLDVATAPLEDAGDYLTDPIEAPANYKDQAKIDAYIANARQAKLDKAALDPDLCRISGVAWAWVPEVPAGDPMVDVRLANTDDESDMLLELTDEIDLSTVLVGFNSRSFDWRVLMRRALYLGVKFPRINVDRYRSTHVDLFDVLSDKGTGTAHSLQFYVKRFGWTDLSKPLEGAAEAQVFQTGQWAELALSLSHDVLASYRLFEKVGR